MRLGHIELFVKEPLKSLEFYRDTLGFDVVAIQQERFIWLSKGPVEILLRPGRGGAEAERYSDSTAGIVFYTEDLTATADDLRSRGLQFNGTDGSDSCLTFMDPDGHWFQLVNPSHA